MALPLTVTFQFHIASLEVLVHQVYRESKAETEGRCRNCHLNALPHPVTGPELAPLAHYQTLTPWLCMGHGAAPGVSLWGILGAATGDIPTLPG
jgi:hypothetical protein